MYCMLTWHCLATGNLNVARPALKKSWYLALKSFLRKLQTAAHNQLSPLAKLSRLNCEIILWHTIGSRPSRLGMRRKRGGPKIFEKIELLAPELFVCLLHMQLGKWIITEKNKTHSDAKENVVCQSETQLTA